MADTVKRLSIALYKEDLRILKSLMKEFGESNAAVIRRALMYLNCVTLHERNVKISQVSKESDET